MKQDLAALRLLVVPALLALSAGAATSIVAMNVGMALLIAVLVAAASDEERRRFADALVVLAPWALATVASFAANWGLPFGRLRPFFPWLALPLAAAFLPLIDERRRQAWFFAAAGAAAALGLWQHLQGIGVIDTGLCGFTAGEYDGKLDKLLCAYKAGTRARGFFYTPMTFGAVAAIGLLAAAAFAKDLGKKAYWIIPLLAAALAVSSTRSAWLALAAGLPFVLGVNKRAWAAAAVAGALVAGVAAANPVLRSRALSLASIDLKNADPSTSTGARLFLWRDAVAQFQERPLFGWGPGTFRKNVETRHPEVKLLSTKHAHSNYLQILAESGLVGLAGFLATFVWIGLRVARRQGAHRRLGFALLAALFVSGFFEASIFDSEVVVNLFVWTAVVLAASPAPPPREPSAL